MNDFWKENDLDGSQGDLRALGHPQRPRQAQPWGVQQVPFIFIKMNIWNMFHKRFLKRKRSGRVPRWSEGSRTPSATSSSSTMGSSASKTCTSTATSSSSTIRSTAITRYVHQKLIWLMFIHYPSMKNRFETVTVSYRVIKLLYKHRTCQLLMNITGTCCTRQGWACQGRWGCQRALRSPLDPSRSFSFQKSFMKHI